MTLDPRQLLILLTWMSPAFPVGQFAYSHGLEWAVEEGSVRDAPTLAQWIGDVLTRGSGWNDAVLFARCWQDDPAELNELALALAGSKERHLETAQLGRSFSIAASMFHPLPSAVAEERDDFADIAYPVAAGSACVSLGIPKHEALLAFLQGFAAAMTSVAVRLVPLGQTAGLETLRGLMPVIAAAAERAAAATPGELGAITLFSDIASMKHETQFSRVFRT